MKILKIAFITLSLIFTFTLGLVAAEKSGSFRGADGEQVKGSAKWVANGKKNTISFSASFKASAGPDLYVYVGNSKPSRIIGKLRRTSGAQKYTVPASVKPSSYSKIFIHCKKYNHTFGSARLR